MGTMTLEKSMPVKIEWHVGSMTLEKSMPVII